MRFPRLSPLLLALLAAACAAPAKYAPPTTAAAEAPRAFLWEVTRPEAPDKPLYLTGSVHLGKPGQFIFPPSMEAAFARSQALVVELDPTKAEGQEVQQGVTRLGILTPPDGLSEHLSAETRALLPGALQRLGFPRVAAERMRPWLLAITLEVLELQKAGYSDASGIDQLLLGRARGKMKVVELETPEAQIRVLAGFPDEVQELMLKEQLQDESVTGEALGKMTAAWSAGDPDALATMLFENAGNPVYEPFYEALFFARNRRMADKLVELLDAPETHFAVVGAGHLVGKEGLVDLLTRRGLNVRQLPREP